MLAHRHVPHPAPYKGIYPLTAYNYKIWATLLRHHLQGKGAYYTAMAAAPPPAPADVRTAWVTCNAKCLATALKTMDQPHFTLCADYAMFRELWDFLRNKYEVPNQQATEAYARDLETITLDSQESIPDYFMRIRQISAKLTAAGEQIPDHH